MRGVQDTYGVSGYADNRKPYGAHSPAMRLRFPFDARLSGLAGLNIYTSSDSAVCPQTWKPAHPVEQLKLQQLSAVTGVSKGHHGLMRQLRMAGRVVWESGNDEFPLSHS